MIVFRWLANTLASVARIVAVPLLIIAVIALVTDVTRIMNGTSIRFATVNEHWTRLAPQSLTAAKVFVQKSTHPLVWDQGVQSLIAMPAFAMFGILGGVVGYLGRRRRRVNVFVN